MANYFGHPSEKLNLVGIPERTGRLPSLLYYINCLKKQVLVGLISTVKIVDNIEYKSYAYDA
jgi:hypothetical protein